MYAHRKSWKNETNDADGEDEGLISHKVKDLLVASALGMEPNTQWDGLEDANGGYIVVKDDGEVVFNEINTMPGFTAISMYPMLWEARGITKDQLVDMLMAHGMERYT